jgi:hypothetical protein
VRTGDGNHDPSHGFPRARGRWRLSGGADGPGCHGSDDVTDRLARWASRASARHGRHQSHQSDGRHEQKHDCPLPSPPKSS